MRMKRQLLLYIISVIVSLGLGATTYSVKEIPNVHLADSTRFVSNPDGILSADGEARINAALRRVHGQTSAEFVVVAVDELDEDIDEFATNLFRAWGLGKKDTNNGLLLLISKNDREMVFRTGGGMEGLLPDGLLGSIIRKDIAPRFRNGDFDGGVLAGVNSVNSILLDPAARQEIMSRYANDASDSDDDLGDNLFIFYIACCAIMALASLLMLAVALLNSRGKDRYAKYQALNKIYPAILFLSFIGLGMPLIALIPTMVLRKRMRRGPHPCPRCGTPMQLIDEQHDNDFLSRAQDLEEQIGSIDYDVWVCPNDGETEIIPYLQRSSAYKECPVCHARTYRVISDRILIKPTTSNEGLRQITSRCVNCGHEGHENHTIPREAEAPKIIILPGAIGGSNGDSGGPFGGGSFGGGFTAGGGARGGW